MKAALRRVGRTKLKIDSFGLGTASLAGNMRSVSESDARGLVAAAYDAGVRYFDTAPFYGYGKSEHMVGNELRERSDWKLSTKVGRVLTPRTKKQKAGDQWQNPLPFEPHFDYSYDAIMRSYEDSQQRLGLKHIDILYLHDVDTWLEEIDKPKRAFRKAIKSAYKALDELRRNGDVSAIGLGVNQAQPIEDALEFGQWDICILAGRYTLLEQAPLHSLFPMLKKAGTSIVIGGPFNSGILVGGDTFDYRKAPAAVVDRVKRIAAVCNAHNIPMAAAALQFPVTHPVVASVIPGPRSVEEFKQIAAWWEIPIPPALWRDLKTEGVLDAEAPTPK
jgi:D-threo-aldose 1-dehydrogenase